MWNATEFGGIGDIRLPPKMVWVPDVLLYNSVDESFDSTYPSNVIVRYIVIYIVIIEQNVDLEAN